jgi:hypothetical protein
VLIELTHSGISIEPIDITGAYVHQDLTGDHGDVSSDHITLPFVLSDSASSTVSGDLLEVSLASNDLLVASVESDNLSGLSGDLSDSYNASGFEPCIFSPSKVVRDLVESDEVFDLSALMSDDLEDTNHRTDDTELLISSLRTLLLLCSTSTLLSSLIMTSTCKMARTAKSKLLSKEGVGSSNLVLKQFLMVWDIFI